MNKTGKKNVVTIPIIQEINKKYNEGLTMKSLAKMYGLTENTIGKYIWESRRSHGEK